MTHASSLVQELPRRTRSHLDWVFPVLFKPHGAFQQIASYDRPCWLSPMLLLSLAAILLVLVSAPLQQAILASGETPLPPNFQYFTPEQQAQYLKAQEASAGPVFLILLPALGALSRIWIGWILVGAGLHFLLTLLGSRGNARNIMNLVAWAGLPFALRSLVRILYTLIANKQITGPGLSAAVPMESGMGSLVLHELLSLVDLYWAWHIILLLIAIGNLEYLSRRRAYLSLGITQCLALALQVLPGIAQSKLSGLTIIRPFF